VSVDNPSGTAVFFTQKAPLFCGDSESGARRGKYAGLRAYGGIPTSTLSAGSLSTYEVAS